MPAGLAHWLAMDGYAAYVWPAYGLAVAIIGGLALASILSARAARRELQRLQQDQPRGGG
jgi:heme exporter protein D